MHSHSSIQFLVKRAEEMAQRRTRKDCKPLWLNHFIDLTADLFEPDTEAARVGYECQLEEDGWRVHFYLGDAEYFGGAEDGRRERIGFDFDLKGLLDTFETVESLRNQIRQADAAPETCCTMIEVTGLLSGCFDHQPLTVGILSRPPREAGPGVRIHPNGEIEAV